MISMISKPLSKSLFEPCNWYKNIKQGSSLDNFIEERSIDVPSTYCENDIQIMTVNYIQCVKLDEIKKVEPWSPSREEEIRKWATPDKLRRLKYSQEEGNGKRIIPHTAFHDIPMLYRDYKLDNKDQEKFTISDGIHRINRARELHMECILASVEERIKINKTDTKNVDIR